MIEITDYAASELKQLLEEQNKKDHGLRIFAAGFGCRGIQYGLSLEKSPGKEDDVLESNGIKIIFSKDLQEDIEELKIDFIDNGHGKGFVINNPGMGCGPGCGSCE
ncbi:iron-sulfur cluster assembly accessory protein [groundwater metagenome]